LRNREVSAKSMCATCLGASSDEVLQFFANAGIRGVPFFQASVTQSELAKISGFQDLVGVTVRAGIPGSFERPVTTEQDGSGLWFAANEAEGFDYEITDGRFLVSDTENGDREVGAGEILEFPVPVDQFSVIAIVAPAVEGARGENPAPDTFIATSFLRFDSAMVSFELTPLGEIRTRVPTLFVTTAIPVSAARNVRTPATRSTTTV
jgi:hypothetical protein